MVVHQDKAKLPITKLTTTSVGIAKETGNTTG